MSGRTRHPKKEVEQALRFAEASDWSVEPKKGGHAWGEIRCPTGRCRVAVWSTPRSPGKHAKALIARVRRCPHVATEG